MDLNEYQNKALATAVFPVKTGIEYCALKLCGEAGEHAEKLAKLKFRDDQGNFDTMNDEVKRIAIAAIVHELGDVLWYVANLADLYGYTLTQVASMNLLKLQDRQERGVLKGSGDDR